MQVWNSPSFNQKADDAIGDIYREWGAANNAEINYQIIPATEWKQRITAALEAKQPPDVFYVFEADTQYYREQGLLQDMTDIIEAVDKLEGGLFEATKLTTGYQGKYYAIPFVVNPWVMHTRDDVLKQAGVEYPKTWEDMIAVSDKISKPPQVYTYSMSLGENHDTVNNFIAMAWCYGGRMQNEQGALEFKSPGTLDTIKLVKEMYAKKVIPPGATTWDSSGNNKAYQSRQCVFAHNPNSIYAFLESEATKSDATDLAKDLLASTGMYGLPSGSKGSFDMIDVRGFASFSGGPNPAAAKEALKFFIQPKNYERVIETGLNRWAPVYKNMMDRPLWDKPAYKNYKQLMQNGRVMAYGGPPNAALGETLDAWIVTAMLHDVCTGGKDPERAMNEAYDKMVAIYKKWNQAIA